MIRLIICNPLRYLCDNLSGNNSAQLRSATSKNKLILLASTGLIFKGLYRVKKSSVQGQQLQRSSQKFFWKVGCWLLWWTKKILRFLTTYLNGHIWHIVRLGTDPRSKPQPSIFFTVPPCTEKLIIKFFTEKLITFLYLNVSAPGNFSVQIILTCSTCLKITFVLISEQPKTP